MIDLILLTKRMSHYEEYLKLGYTVVDNFLPIEAAMAINTLYASQANWEQINQVRDEHYKHVFLTQSSALPKFPEKYIARFGRSSEIEKSPDFTDLYNKYITKAIGKIVDVNITHFDVRCYRLLPGDLYRTHIDDYAADVGLVYYINKDWRWDWGGILHIAQDQDKASLASVLPKFNRAVILNHGIFRFPHFVSQVSDFALEPRYTIVSFNR